MTRKELIERITKIGNSASSNPIMQGQLDLLIEDINADGVLDVQCLPDIAEAMDLPRPATSDTLIEATDPDMNT